MARSYLRACLIGAALLAAIPASAQDKPGADDNSAIVVTGSRDLDAQVRDFVGALTPGPGTRQISRFERAVCPLAVGVSPGHKEAVAVRVRRIAKAAGVSVGSASCTPNVLVVVTSDKKLFIEELRKKYPYYFGGLTRDEIRRIAEEPGPAAAWQVKTMVTQDGVTMSADPDGVLINQTTARPSRITAPARPAFVAAAVVVESKALEGLTTTQLADYAAMRVLARTDPSRLADSSASTILKIFDAPMGSAVPITLTEWDLGFLRGLYSSPQNLRAAAQRSAIGRQLGKELEQAEGDGKE